MESIDHTQSRFFKSKGGSWTMRIGTSDQYNFFIQQKPMIAVQVNKALSRAIATNAVIEVTPATATVEDAKSLEEEYFKSNIPPSWLFRFQELGLVEDDSKDLEDDEAPKSSRSSSTQKVEVPATSTSRRSKRTK